MYDTTLSSEVCLDIQMLVRQLLLVLHSSSIGSTCKNLGRP
jgi:hypothetical protein